eukprot:11162979-Lingulodinium_polyedra.AAC.1
MHYALPGNFLQDKLYYGLLFELVIDERSVLGRRRGEVLVPSTAIHLNTVYLLTNLNIASGGPKSPVWDPVFEVLPSGLT